MLSRHLAVSPIRNNLIHTSASTAARPTYGLGRKGQRFVPARARLAEPDQTHAKTQKPRERERQRQLIIPLPDSEHRDIDPGDIEPLSQTTSSRFTTPPLLPGIVSQIHELLGTKAKPTPVQNISLSHFFRNDKTTDANTNGTLLAAETGSGKSLAYLLPLVQALKTSESSAREPSASDLASPRALILVPTHELARQIKSTLSHLTHAPDTKLRSICVSTGSADSLSARAAQSMPSPSEEGEFQVSALEQTRRDPDVVVGTPAKILDLTRPSGRHSVGPMRPTYEDRVRREFERNVKMGYEKVEWVVVDEADVLFGSSISKDLTRLTTPDLHRLPASLQTEYVEWDRRPGNRNPMILRKLRDTWAEEARQHPGWKEKSKVIIFCNRSKKVEELGEYLKREGIKCVSLTSESENRQRGSNKHISAFLKPFPGAIRKGASNSSSEDSLDVLVTTSLLSRGLDFTPAVRSVFIVDEPRNEVDFIHRAGRVGRAGRAGRVVVFTDGKNKGAVLGKRAQGGEKRNAGVRKISAFDAA
ncbi:DEAD domain-containing protein [Rhizoctonia solani AG-1 IA]|uniref:ATP-dependent RNA helicase n=1 Tax=Thanatephorus cucumeris (strain AG1-IA) TaxID=983506 RepID=L8WT93_THACA|nr:DEAD domain-containing protein [Rhizoctonia solani AG-1 IA]